MIYLLGALLAFTCSALVALTTGAFIAAGKDAQRRDRREALLLRCITARVSTENMMPGAELRAYRLLERDARDGFDPDAELARELDRTRAREAREARMEIPIDPETREQMHPTGL